MLGPMGTERGDRVEEVLRALAGHDGPVEVVGDDGLAQALRERLGSRDADADRPAVVIETAGTAGGLQAALERVDDLGVVLLAGPEPPGAVALDLYADLHVRGLTLTTA